MVADAPSPFTNAQAEAILWAEFRRATTPEEFFAGWLALQAHWVPKTRSAILFMARGDRDGQEKPTLDAVAQWPASAEPNEQHMLDAANRAQREGVGLALELGAPSDRGAFSVVAQPIEQDGRLIGVVVLEIALSSQEKLTSALRMLGWGSAWLQLISTDRSPTTSLPPLLEALLDAVATPLEHERFRAAAAALVTELASRLDCERVSLGFVESGAVRLSALSHSASFGDRANLSRAIEGTMDEALDQQSEIQWPASETKPPRVTRNHEALAGRGQNLAILSIPFAHGNRYCGVATLERNVAQPFTNDEQRLVRAALDLAGPMLDIQRRDERWLGTKAWEAGRDFLGRLVGPRHVGLKLTAIAATLLLLFVCFVKGDYRIRADGVLEAQVVRAAVAPFGGYIDQAPIRAGDLVHEHDLLAQLEDHDLKLERMRWSSELARLQQQHREALAEERLPDVQVLSAQITQVSAQLELAESQLERSRIVAPFDGIVVTGDLSQQLGSPVERGDLLFEVAPLNAWRLVLQVEEREIDEISVGQQGVMIFAASPQSPIQLEIVRITPVAEVDEGQNTFRVEAKLDSDDTTLQPGMEGVAKIDVGQSRLIWIWTHEVVDWLTLLAWSYLP